MKRTQSTVSYRPNSSRSPKEILKITRATIDKATRSIRPYEGNHAGRGITVCAGGYVYFTQAWVLIRMLRKLGCGLPVQFWYYGEKEMDDRMKKLVEPYGVDAKKVAKHAGVQVGQGWPLKPFSILHAPCDKGVAATKRAAFKSEQQDDGAQIEAARHNLSGLKDARDDAAGTLNGYNTRALSAIRGIFGPDCTEYDQAGGTRTSERKRPVRQVEAKK